MRLEGTMQDWTVANKMCNTLTKYEHDFVSVLYNLRRESLLMREAVYEYNLK